MDHALRTCCLVAALLISAEHCLQAEHPARGKIRIADRPGENFASIQAAVEAAAAGATVLIGAGRYDERLKIGKPVTLVGAGPDKTVIVPTAAARQLDVETFRVRQLESQEWSSRGTVPAESRKRLAWAEMRALSAAMIKVEDVQGVELRSLGVSSPGDPRSDNRVDQSFHGVELKNAGLRMTDCAVVGCLGDGVHVEGESNLEIDDCLIGGCWSMGVSATGHAPVRLKLVNSDIRNCYRTNIWAHAIGNVLAVEGCRISGSAMSGIHCSGQAAIVHSAVFENYQVGIESLGDAVIQQNLICRNRARGMVCWPESNSLLEGNLFMDNGAAICVSGKNEPTIRRNVFVGGSVAVEYLPHGKPGGIVPATSTYHVQENLFWRIDRPVVRRELVGKGARVQTEVVELPAADNNRTEDPRITIGSDGQVFLAEDAPAGPIDFAGITAATMKTRWPLTSEERAMIPDDGSRDSSRWKLQPAPRKR
jgi:Right handed beta helix region